MSHSTELITAELMTRLNDLLESSDDRPSLRHIATPKSGSGTQQLPHSRDFFAVVKSSSRRLNYQVSRPRPLDIRGPLQETLQISVRYTQLCHECQKLCSHYYETVCSEILVDLGCEIVFSILYLFSIRRASEGSYFLHESINLLFRVVEVR